MIERSAAVSNRSRHADLGRDIGVPAVADQRAHHCVIAAYHGSWERPDNGFADMVLAAAAKGNAPDFEMPVGTRNDTGEVSSSGHHATRRRRRRRLHSARRTMTNAPARAPLSGHGEALRHASSTLTTAGQLGPEFALWISLFAESLRPRARPPSFVVAMSSRASLLPQMSRRRTLFSTGNILTAPTRNAVRRVPFCWTYLRLHCRKDALARETSSANAICLVTGVRAYGVSACHTCYPAVH
jgi:hypothetical protein